MKLFNIRKTFNNVAALLFRRRTLALATAAPLLFSAMQIHPVAAAAGQNPLAKVPDISTYIQNDYSSLFTNPLIVEAVSNVFGGEKTTLAAIAAVQSFLADKGFYKDKIDNKAGPNTLEALRQFLNSVQLDAGTANDYAGTQLATAFAEFLEIKIQASTYPKGMLLYNSRDGVLILDNIIVGTGHSGIGPGTDNPKMQCIENTGPIPAALYEINLPGDHGTEGQIPGENPMRLTRVGSPDPCGRDGFFMHLLRGIATHGCVAFSQQIINFIADLRRSGAVLWLQVAVGPIAKPFNVTLYQPGEARPKLPPQALAAASEKRLASLQRLQRTVLSVTNQHWSAFRAVTYRMAHNIDETQKWNAALTAERNFVLQMPVAKVPVTYEKVSFGNPFTVYEMQTTHHPHPHTLATHHDQRQPNRHAENDNLLAPQSDSYWDDTKPMALFNACKRINTYLRQHHNGEDDLPLLDVNMTNLDLAKAWLAADMAKLPKEMQKVRKEIARKADNKLDTKKIAALKQEIRILVKILASDELIIGKKRELGILTGRYAKTQSVAACRNELFAKQDQVGEATEIMQALARLKLDEMPAVVTAGSAQPSDANKVVRLIPKRIGMSKQPPVQFPAVA